MTTPPWTHLDDIELVLSVGPIDIGTPVAIEGNGEARRAMIVMVVEGQPEILARWRDAVPSSLRVFRLPGLDKSSRDAYERQLLDYARGTREIPAYDLRLGLYEVTE